METNTLTAETNCENQTENESKKPKKLTRKQIEQNEARANLLELVKPGDTVYCILRHVSSSGMSRRISFVTINGADIRQLDYNIARLLNYRTGNKEGLIVSGCGMDMGFHVVYELSRKLFQGNYICTGENCRSNDHSNGDRDRTPHPHSDGGYALNSRWL